MIIILKLIHLQLKNVMLLGLHRQLLFIHYLGKDDAKDIPPVEGAELVANAEGNMRLQ